MEEVRTLESVVDTLNAVKTVNEEIKQFMDNYRKQEEDVENAYPEEIRNMDLPRVSDILRVCPNQQEFYGCDIEAMLCLPRKLLSHKGFQHLCLEGYLSVTSAGLPVVNDKDKVKDFIEEWCDNNYRYEISDILSEDICLSNKIKKITKLQTQWENTAKLLVKLDTLL